MAARLIVLALAVVLGGFGLIARHDARQCDAQLVASFRAVAAKPPHFSPTQADLLMDACRGSHDLAFVANGLAQHGLPREAIRLSNEAIRREPENFEGWVALSQTLGARHLKAAAARALRSALKLNPRFGRELTG